MAFLNWDLGCSASGVWNSGWDFGVWFLRWRFGCVILGWSFRDARFGVVLFWVMFRSDG